MVPVWCVVPWHDRASTLAALVEDLFRLSLRVECRSTPIELRLRVILVDNAATEPLPRLAPGTERHRTGACAAWRPPEIEQLRLDENRGGSGGFNAGIARALELSQGQRHGYVWLLDSDARVPPNALIELARVLETRAGLCAVGSALADPETGTVFEVGGRIDRRTGVLGPADASGGAEIVLCDYVATSSALVRLAAVRCTGPLPDLFLHADDATWFLRMQRRTGACVAGVPASVVYHPLFDRFPLRGRYYAARNGIVPLRELGLGRRVALRRTMREVGRAVQQELLGRSDLAALHLAGLEDAAGGALTGAGRGLDLSFEPFRPLRDLAAELARWGDAVEGASAGLPDRQTLRLDREPYDELRRQLERAGLRVDDRSRGRGRRSWLIVPAGARGWGRLRGAGLVEIAARVRGSEQREGFVIRRVASTRRLARGVVTGCRGTLQALRIAWRWRTGKGEPLPAAREAGSSPVTTHSLAPQVDSSLSVVIVSYNRRAALRSSLRRLCAMGVLAHAEILVIDNASDDGAVEGLEEELDRVRVFRAGENLGVGAFNLGVARARGETVLVLDDDACPEEEGLAHALAILAARPDVAAVALHPRHPTSGNSEWRFASAAAGGCDDWPVLGCGNLVRRSVWLAVGGYDPGFFLYRNDVDLALKILQSGWRVYFDPGWVVWHDSAHVRRKSLRWHRLATRNWIWIARRYGRGIGLGGVLGGILGLLWAHWLAGLDPKSHWATLQGIAEGVGRRSPSPDRSCSDPAQNHFGRLVRLAGTVVTARPGLRGLRAPSPARSATGHRGDTERTA